MNVEAEKAAISKMEGSGDIHHTICIDVEKSPCRKKPSVSYLPLK